MASSELEDFSSLSEHFERYFNIYEEIESSDLPTNSDELQDKVKVEIHNLETTTMLVSQADVFSNNETLEELPTSSIKFLVLPFIMGKLSLKLTSQQRMEVLRLSQIYFVDFLRRCKEYHLTNVVLPKAEEEEVEEDEGNDNKQGIRSKPPVANKRPTIEELQVMGRQREEKLKRFKEKKTVSDKVSELKCLITSPSSNEDAVREYFITLIKKFIFESLDELDSITMEYKMLTDIANMKKEDRLPAKEDLPKKGAFRPFLLTRDDLQKKIYGHGYPSLPAMTVDEFYEQRVREGTFPGTVTKYSNKETKDQQSEAVDQQDHDAIAKDVAEENDDPNEINRLRNRDEWRDTHRTGWGNTHNRS